MRVVISVATYYPDKNGVQYMTQALAEGLEKSGHDVTVITKLHQDCGNDAYVNGVRVIRLDIRNKNMFHFGDKEGFCNAVIRESKSADSVVFVCLESVAADWALGILDEIRCQKILYMHGMHRFEWEKIDFSNGKNFIYKLLRDIRWGIFYQWNRRNIAKFDKVIHLHGQDKAYYYFEKRYPGKNYVLENFAEDIFFEREKDEGKAADYYIYVSNYHPRKNQRLLLEAFYLMKHDFKLVFIGSKKNAYYQKLVMRKEALDKKYNVKKDILFLDDISRESMAKYLKEAYAFVMTSKSEFFPIVLLEAMASGIPYISTDVGIVKFLPGGTITPDNKFEVAKNMDQLIENREKYETLKKEAGQQAKNKYAFEQYLTEFNHIVKDERK